MVEKIGEEKLNSWRDPPPSFVWCLTFFAYLTLSYKIKSLKHRNVTSKGHLKMSLNAWIIDFVDCRRVRKTKCYWQNNNLCKSNFSLCHKMVRAWKMQWNWIFVPYPRPLLPGLPGYLLIPPLTPNLIRGKTSEDKKRRRQSISS